MPEPRIRDVVSSGAGKSGARSSVAKAAGDSIPCTVCPHQEIFRSSNKHKIPRSLRYDLENAYMSGYHTNLLQNCPFVIFQCDSYISYLLLLHLDKLCDVWFGEIKPYLVRNNIKLHVNCDNASGDHQYSSAAADATASSPSLDPGAAPDNPPRTARYAGSSAPPVARTPRRDPTTGCTSSRRPLSPLLSVPQTPHDGSPVQSHKNEKNKVGQPCNRRRLRRRAQPNPSWRVPRLCRTFTALCRPGSGTGSCAVNTTSHPPPSQLQQRSPHNDFYRFIVPRRESVMKNKTTQTEQAPSVSRASQSVQPRYRMPGRPSPRHTLHRCAEPKLDRTASSNGSAPSPPILSPSIICAPKRPQALAAELPPLLQNDLIDIIAEVNEKRLKLLYSSSQKDDRDQPSFMNLIASSRQGKLDQKKLRPWR